MYECQRRVWWPEINPVAIEKVKQLVEIRERRQLHFVLEVDGGINVETIGDCYAAGATWFVAGSSIFKYNAINRQ